MLGEKFINKSGQEYEVIAAGPKKKNGNGTWILRFTETGYVTAPVEKVQITRGKIKDRYAKDIFGVGYIGMAEVTPNISAHSVWYKMMQRCYDPSCISYADYGAKGVYVDERWHCFEHFLADLPFVEGYKEAQASSQRYHLDKDKKHVGDGPKYYSRNTCCFISQSENSSLIDRSHREKSFIAISPEGKRIEVKGIRQFARDHHLTKQGISSCLAGRGHTHKGWRFENI
jgi:hypothetical protein